MDEYISDQEGLLQLCPMTRVTRLWLWGGKWRWIYEEEDPRSDYAAAWPDPVLLWVVVDEDLGVAEGTLLPEVLLPDGLLME